MAKNGIGLQVNPDLAGDDEPAALPSGVFLIGAELPGDRVELFQVNGRVYTVPRRVDPGIAFRYMRSLRRRTNEQAAIADMLYDVLGDAVIDALADEDLSEEEMTAVMKAVEKHVMSVMKRAGLGN